MKMPQSYHLVSKPDVPQQVQPLVHCQLQQAPNLPTPSQGFMVPIHHRLNTMTGSVESHQQGPSHQMLSIPTVPEDSVPSTVPLSRINHNLRLNDMRVQVLVPTSSQVPPYGSGAGGQQQPMPHGFTEPPNAGEDFQNGSAAPLSSGAFSEISGNNWIGKLSFEWNDTTFHAWVLATGPVRNPKLPTWPNDWSLELVFDAETDSRSIQAWIREYNAAVVRLRCIDEMGNWHFSRLVETLRNCRGYAVVRWEKWGQTVDQLLLAPCNDGLLCAAFPDHSNSERPTRQPPRPFRVLKRQPKPEPDSAAMPTPPDEATQSTIAPPQPLPEHPPVVYHPPDAVKFTHDDLYPIRHGGQANTFTPLRAMSQQTYVQAQQDERSVPPDLMDVDREQLVDQRTDASSAGCSTDTFDCVSDTDAGGDSGGSAHLVGEDATSSPSVNSETWKALFNEWVNLDGNTT